MTRILSFIAVFVVPAIPAPVEWPINAGHDASSKLLYETYTRGNITETLDPSGKMVTKSKTTDGKTRDRSPTGKLLQEKGVRPFHS